MPIKDYDERMAYQREYQRNWYQRHKEKILEKNKERQKRILEWYREYKTNLGCADCGERHPACLEFHHKDRSDKSYTIARVISRASSVKAIMKEIDKCELLCANCHRKRHWRERHASDEWEEIIEMK